MPFRSHVPLIDVALLAKSIEVEPDSAPNTNEGER
jgi:hypothetical protein